MQKCYTILLFICMSVFTHGSVYIPMPVGNDTIVRQLCPYIAPGNSGDNLTWDFRNLVSSGEYEITTSYTNLPDSHFLSVREPHTRYYWQVKADTLKQIGYENAHAKVNYTCPAYLRKCTLTINDTLSCFFEAMGEYGHRLPVMMSGQTLVVPDASGTILLGNETFTNTMRVHTIRRYNELFGIANVEEHTWQWFSEESAYPIVDIVRSIRIHGAGSSIDTTIYAATWIAIPPPQRKKQNAKQPLNITPHDTLLTEIQCAPNPVSESLHVSYFLTREANVNISIYNPSGVKIYSSASTIQSQGYYTHYISTSAFMTGTYVLHIVADDMEIQKVIIKR